MKLSVILVMLLCLSYLCEMEKFYSGMFEGDIAVREINIDDKDEESYVAFLRHTSRKWPFNHVPYYIDESSIRLAFSL